MENRNRFEKNEDGSEVPEKLVDEIVTSLDNLHKELVDSATKVGYARDTFQAMRPVWAHLSNISLTDPDVQQVYSTGVNVLLAYRDELRAYQDGYAPFGQLLDNAISSGSPANTTAATASLMIDDDFVLPENVFPTRVQHETCVEKLARLDPALGQVYQEMWEILYGTRADPERGALFLIRQAFDHFFGLLAPDDAVRKSRFWKRKEDEKDDLVTREERVLYAADTRISDVFRARTLSESAKHMVRVYKTLNRAHERGTLKRQKTREALKEMTSILEDWVNALEF